MEVLERMCVIQFSFLSLFFLFIYLFGRGVTVYFDIDTMFLILLVLLVILQVFFAIWTAYQLTMLGPNVFCFEA